MASDLLAGADWHCNSAAPGEIADHTEAFANSAGVFDAQVPGTVAGALRTAGVHTFADLDGADWWYRTSFRVDAPGDHVLTLGGLATLATVWLDDEQLLASDNMFRTHRRRITLTAGQHALTIRFAALTPELGRRRPRPRWKVPRLRHPGLRWFRTSLLGRLNGWPETPPPAGPYRPVTLSPAAPVEISDFHVRVRCAEDGEGGSVEVTVSIESDGPPQSARLFVGSTTAELRPVAAGHGSPAANRAYHAVVELDHVERWWPHTHGDQPTYPVTVEFDGHRTELRRIAFRTISADRTDGDFRLSVNDVPIFARGAYWTPLDATTLNSTPADYRSALGQVRSANLNMLRVGGETLYEADDFLDLCDELGILIWQDVMLAFSDPPEDEAWRTSFLAEAQEQLARYQGRGCLAVVSGGSEITQQATYSASARGTDIPLLATALPDLVAEVAPGTPYAESSPSGGKPPTRPDTGVAHYYGLGAYLRGADDVRRSCVRFAAECLALATPPEAGTVEQVFGGPAVAGHHPGWKRGVYRDAAASWDFEDVTAFYTRKLFGVDTFQLRHDDPERALDLARATVSELFTIAFSEWRRPGSTCRGALVFYLRDLVAGAGLGVVDSFGLPKAPWYVLRRLCAPTSVTITDEGLNGLAAHICNDSADPLIADLEVNLFASGEHLIESASRPLKVPARSGRSIDLDAMFDGFRDLSYAHRFGPLAYDVVGVTLTAADGEVLGTAVHLPAGPARPVEPDLGLTAEFAKQGDSWVVNLHTRRFAHYVRIDVPGYQPADSWFHVTPGAQIEVPLTGTSSAGALRGSVSALNCLRPSTIVQPLESAE